MKKKIVILPIIFIIFIIIAIIFYDNKKVIYKNEVVPVIRKKDELLSYYLEDDSGDYALSSGVSWPTKGYLFNSDKSKCENGSTLTWNDETNSILVTGKMSDRCFIYFDKVILPTVTVTVGEVTGSSITVNLTSSKGTFDISEYYYSCDNGSTFTSSTNTTHTFYNLDAGATYNIVIYALDIKGNESLHYSIAGSTKPVINSVSVQDFDAWSYVLNLTVDYTSKNTISESYVSIDNEDYIKNNNDYGLFSYDVECLSSSPNIKLYMKDLNGNTSDVYSISYKYSCFPAGTKILFETGYKNIEDIKIGDFVYSYNELTKNVELNNVAKKIVHEDVEIYKLYLGSEIIKVTPFHRFYVLRDNNFKWIAVKNLKLTDKLFDVNKKLININKIEYMKENNKVYNFEVKNNHTYFVSEKNILVHNVKAPCSYDDSSDDLDE